MPAPSEFSFSFGPSGQSLPPRPAPETPFRILVLADFSSRSSRGLLDPNFASRPLLRADIDTLDSLFAAVGAAVRLSTPAFERPFDIPLTGLDDFHPDQLVRKVPLFKPLLDLRARLTDPATAAEAAADARALFGLPAPAPRDAAASTPAATMPTSGGSLLESLLGGRPAGAPQTANPTPSSPPSPPAANPIADLVRRLAQSASAGSAPAAPADPHGPMLLAALDDRIASHLRTILHNPAFQRTEATWRALHFLLTSISTDETLTVDIVDVSKSELVADMHAAAAAGNLQRSSLFQLIAGRTQIPGVDPWSLVVADLTLDYTTPDAALAAHLAAAAARAGCALLAAASPAHVGCPGFSIAPDCEAWSPHAPAGDDAAPAAWAAVRQTPDARHLCLALPRFLLRVPYSPNTDPCETFAFCELASPADHESYLWGNPAYAAAVLIAAAFAEDGPDMLCPDAGDITGLPVHTYVEHGHAHATPPAEAWLTHKSAHALQNAGLTPLLSIKNRDAARFPAIQSFADPITPLAGRWSSAQD